MNFQPSEKEVDEAISEIVAEIQWIPNKLTVSEFLSDFRMAQPIRISHGANFDLSPAQTLHPFLAFSRRRRTKVYAENLIWNDILKKYKRKGPVLEIPKDYPGWFEILPNHSCKSTIGEIVEMKCKEFLVRTTVIGHLSADEDANFRMGSEIRIYPGDILRVNDVISKKWRTASVSGAKPLGKKPKELSTRFVDCVDRQQRHIYIPLAHPGEFYAIWDPDVGNAGAESQYVYYISDLIQFDFPLMVRLVFGWPPADFDGFTGLLRLIEVSKPDTLVVRNLRHGSCVIVELPMDCDVRIEKIDDPERFIDSECFEKLLAHASDKIYPYLIGMKQIALEYPMIKNAMLLDRKPSLPFTDEKPTKNLMAKPRDMKNFEILNIYPPLEENILQVSETWTLCFKDPNFSSGDDKKLSVSSENDRTDVAEGVRGIRINDPDKLLRREIDHILTDREADC